MLEPTAAATKAWTSAAVTSGRITGGGHVLNATGTGYVAFGFNAKSDGVLFRGDCNVVDLCGRVRSAPARLLTSAGTRAPSRPPEA